MGEQEENESSLWGEKESGFKEHNIDSNNAEEYTSTFLNLWKNEVLLRTISYTYSV